MWWRSTSAVTTTPAAKHPETLMAKVLHGKG
jgi:hypothetical protein